MTSIPLIAIEGSVCAGKTTLANNLLALREFRGWVVIPDYADAVGGGTGMPSPAPAQVEDELVAVDALLEIEASRWNGASRIDDQVILDRSVLTIAAHAAGLVNARMLPAEALTEVEAYLEHDERPNWPTRVVYLDVDMNTQLSRNQGKLELESTFLNRSLNIGFRYWHRRLADSGLGPRYLWLDGTSDQFDLAQAAAAQITSWIEE